MYNYYGKHNLVRVVAPEAHLIEQRGDMTPYKFIETIGRTCYKSEDKITDTSAEKFVTDLYKRRHLAMIEHLWVHIHMNGTAHDLFCIMSAFSNQCLGDLDTSTPFEWLKHLAVTQTKKGTYISGPLRVFIELDLFLHSKGQDFIEDTLLGLPALLNTVAVKHPLLFTQSYDFHTYTDVFSLITEDHLVCDFIGMKIPNSALMNHVTHTVHFVCDRGVSHELVRHREDISFGQESTRYCNYTLAKFDETIAVIKPFFFERNEDTEDNVLYDDSAYSEWLLSMEHAAKSYFNLLNVYKRSPQEARSVLPNSLKTEIILTANETEWQHIINLRYLATTGAPHPQMKEVMSIAAPLLVDVSEDRLTLDRWAVQ